MSLDKSPQKKIQLYLSPEAVDEVDRLRVELNLGSRSEVIRYALGLLKIANEKGTQDLTIDSALR